MIDRVLADVERALQAYRPDDAQRVLRELETWRALAGRWKTARFEPGGPLSVPVTPGTCIEAIHAAVFAAFPERAGAIVAQVARSVWRAGRRVHDGYPFLRDDPPVEDPDRFHCVAVLAPAEVAREELRIVLELAATWRPVSISPYMLPVDVRLDGGALSIVSGRNRVLVNGGEVHDTRRLTDGDLICQSRPTGELVGKLLFLDKVAG